MATTITKATVLGPYKYSEMSTMSGALAGLESGSSGANCFSINSPKQFWVCIVKGA